MKLIFKKKALILILGMIASQSFAQSEIRKYTINSGGGTSTSGTYGLSGSIGQVDVSSELTSVSYSLTGGFWNRANTAPQGDLIFENGFE